MSLLLATFRHLLTENFAFGISDARLEPALIKKIIIGFCNRVYSSIPAQSITRSNCCFSVDLLDKEQFFLRGGRFSL